MQSVRRAIPAFALALIVAAVAAACATAGTAPSTTGPRAERPTYVLGDRWIRNDGVWEVIRVEPDFYVFSKAPGEEIHLTKDLVVARQRQYGGMHFEFTPSPQVPWPLVVGKQGSAIGSFRLASNHEPYDAGLQWSIEAYEEVTVPAGTFQAFRIVYTVVPREVSNFSRRPPWWVQTDRPTTKTFRVWYAPDVQRLVKADGDPWATTRFELVAVDPGDAAPLQIEVQEPKDQTTLLPEPPPVLSGKVSAGKGVRSVEVTVNGEIVFQETAKGEPRRTVVLNASLPLRDGKNIILVTATDPAGTTSQEARTVVYVAPLHLQMPPPGQPLRVGRAHVVLAVPTPPAAFDKVFYVSLNGGIVEWFRAGPARSHSTKMTLEPGANILRIRSAQQPDEERTIIFDPAGDAPPTQLAVVSPSDEVDRLAEDKRREDEQRLANERQGQEARRLAEEKRQQEKQRLADEKRRGEEAQRLAEERRGREDEQRLANEKRQQDEQQRLAEERRRQEEQQRVAALPPLMFSLSSPRDQARFDHESIGLAGLVSGDRGVSRVAITLNGVEVSRQEERTPQRGRTEPADPVARGTEHPGGYRDGGRRDHFPGGSHSLL